ncbi:MAG: hypothetical protein AAF645_12655 [Myxococcota bacterium]
MSALTSLLVRDQRVPVRKIEEAIQRQVIAGGGLDTILLEGAAAAENVVASYCAAVHGLPPASRDECMGVSRDVIRTVPSEVAERHRLIPLNFDGHRLVVAVATPLTYEVDQQLGFLLGVTVEQRIATEARLAAALSQHYGVEMVPRMRRLSRKLAERDAGKLVSVEPLDAPVDEPGANTKRFGTLTPGEFEGEERSSHPARAPSAVPGEAVRVSRTVSLDGVERMGGQTLEQTFNAEDVLAVEASASASQSSAPQAPSQRPAVPSAAPRRLQTLSAPPPPPSRISVPRGSRLKRHRGPLTAHRAAEILKESESRDEILEVGYAFFRQFFDLTALFVVHDGEAEGLDISGAGADLNRFERLGVPLDEPSPFKIAYEGAVPVVTRLDESDLQRRVRSEMARVDLTPALLLPIAIRNRVVLLFYGDRSGEVFELSDVPEPIAFAPRVSEALQRLILRKKIRSGSASGDVASPVPRSNTPPPIADDESHVRWSEPPPPRPQRRSRGRKRSAPFEVLGVPRSAPPPPRPGSQPTVTAPSSPPVPEEAGRDTLVDGTPDLPPVAPSERAPSDGRRAGSYVMKGGTTEIVRRSRHPRSTPSTDTKPERPSARTSLDTLEMPAPFADGEPVPAAAAKDAPAKPAANGDEPDERPVRTSAAPIPLTATLRRPAKPDVAVEETATPLPASSPSEPPPPRTRRPSEPSVVVDDDYESETRAKKDTRPDTPSVIVEMGAGVESAVEDLRYSGPDEPEAAVQAVLQHGEAALPVLVREFPGPLFFDRHQPHRRLPRGRDISAVGRAIVAYGDLAVPYVISLLNRDDADTRFYAVLLSSEFSHARLVQPLGERIFDNDRGVATLALDVLRTLRPFEREKGALMERLRAEARIPRGTDDHRRAALRALGELHDVGALQLLLQFVERDPKLGKAALESLRTLTHQDFAMNVGRWRQWIEENSERHRIEWIIDALSHSEEEVRKAASDELKELTHEYYGYHHALPRKEREIAQRKYRAWWDREGAERFKV